MNKDAKALAKHYKQQVTQKLDYADIHANLLNNYLASDVFTESFQKQYEVPAVGEPLRLDLNYQDGAKVSFKIEAQANDDLEKLNQTQFKVKFNAIDDDTEEQSFDLFTDSEAVNIESASRYVRVSCLASNQRTNVAAVDHDQKFRRDYGNISYVLHSDDKKTTYFITDKAVYQESEYGNKEITPKQENFCLAENKITEIRNFGNIYVFKTESGARFATDEVEKLSIDKIEEQKIMNEVIKEQIRAYVTSEGILHHQGLFDKLAIESDQFELSDLVKFDHPNRVDQFVEGDKIVDLRIGGKGCNKYAILTVNRNGKNLLYSKGFWKNVLCESGRREGDEDKFYLLANQNARTSFDKVFLFDKVAFAVNKTGNLYILGGKLAFENEDIFPKEFGCNMFEGPQRTNLYHAIKELV